MNNNQTNQQNTENSTTTPRFLEEIEKRGQTATHEVGNVIIPIAQNATLQGLKIENIQSVRVESDVSPGLVENFVKEVEILKTQDGGNKSVIIPIAQNATLQELKIENISKNDITDKMTSMRAKSSDASHKVKP